MNFMDPGNLITAVLILIVVVLCVLVWRLHAKGVPNAQLVGQARLQIDDIIDDIDERVVAALKRMAEKAPPPSLKDAYYDKENFDRDVGRVLEAGDHGKMVRLDGAVKIDGDSPAIEYYTQANGNITKTAPTA